MYRFTLTRFILGKAIVFQARLRMCILLIQHGVYGIVDVRNLVTKGKQTKPSRNVDNVK